MPWPLSQDYNEAIQTPASSFSDPELKQGEAVTNALGIPMPCSGNFADVYAFDCPATKKKWAVKCFTRQIPGLRERYVEISAYLKEKTLPFMVDFTFLDQGIRVKREWFPILKMQWVEGFAFNHFVKDHLDKPQILEKLCQLWIPLAARLRKAELAHCDLQHGNVLLVPGSKAGSVGLKLVDYDGMCVPSLTLLKSIELGHPNYQHPQRARERIYNLEVDRFSHLVIYTALRALIVDKTLWQRYDNGDNLLFKKADFEAPGKSALFAELLGGKDPAVRRIAEAAQQACALPLENSALLEEVAEPSRSTASASGPQAEGVPAADAGEAPAVAGSAAGQSRAQALFTAALVGLAFVGGWTMKKLGHLLWTAFVGLAGLGEMAVKKLWPRLWTALVGLAGSDEKAKKLWVGLSAALASLLLIGTLTVYVKINRSGVAETKEDRVVEKDTEDREKNLPGKNGTEPEAKALEKFTNSIGMKLVPIPKGKFMMGSPIYIEDGPQHAVEIPKSFYMGAYEVTSEEYEGVMKSNPSGLKSGKHPAMAVSWDDAVEFCRKLSDLPEEKRAGRTYRLPTEAEWEYACRAGTTTLFHFGNSLAAEQANFNDSFDGTDKGKNRGKIVAVGSYPPNAFGLYDMHGNVCEWCADWYKKDYYANSPSKDPQGPQDGDSRVIRGGTYNDPGISCRTAGRNKGSPGTHYHAVGFRIVCSVMGKNPATFRDNPNK